MIGQTISHYKILEKLGEGGMGVVYKAQDTKLDRLVALKFLPEHVTASEEEKARFLQEARAASALNHPNVCVIHDLQEHGGAQFIVMEYVDGATLRNKFEAGELKVDQVLGYAIQIGEALHEAHSKGIVHRDIKSDNIMINSKNQVKVMDFGLAKLKGPLKLTRTSSTVGTLAYMSPEQIQGGEADARSDIFSFGVVLYEMLTGRTPFHGEHEAAMMYSIVNEEPDPIERYRSNLSPVLANLIQRALEKDPNDRYQSVNDMVIELRRLQKKSSRVMRTAATGVPVTPAQPSTAEAPVTPRPPEARRTSRRYLWVALGVVGLFVVAGGVYWFLGRPKQTEVVSPLLATFEQLTDLPGAEAQPTVSPDGSFIAYTKLTTNGSDIYLQRIGGGNPINLTKDSKDGNSSPSFSPNGDLIAFRSGRDGGGIFIMGATGESIRRLTDFGFDPAWSPDGKEVLLATEGISNPYGRNTTSKLIAVNVQTGAKRTVFEGDGVQPSWSPHGFRIAYWGLPTGSGQRDIWTIPADGGTPRAVTQDVYVDWDPVWSPDGKYLYFSSDRGGSPNIWRIPIDEGSGKVLGDPAPISTPSRWSGYLAVSQDGRRIIYTALDHRSNIYRVAFDANKEAIVGSPVAVTQGTKEMNSFSVSPNGQWLAFTTAGAQEDLFVMKSDGTGMRQLTDDIYKDRGPFWTPDGKRISFYSNRSGRYEIWSINVDGSGLEQLTKTTGDPVLGGVWFPDGKHFGADYGANGAVIFDISKPLENRTPELLPPVSGDSIIFGGGVISPGGKFIAGTRRRRDRSGLPGIALYSLASKSYETLTDSGYDVGWFADGKRLLFGNGRSLYWLDVKTKKQHMILTPPSDVGYSGYDLSADNRTLYFIMNTTEADIWMTTLK
jgi:Tol biopolymer transport system component/predicted Ser/Thr protein kinase